MTRRPVRWMPIVAALSLASLALLVPRSAAAQASRDPAAAGAAFSRGREALRRGELDAACELFAESIRLDPAPGARLNLAECDERRGHYASARQEFEDALLSLPAGDDRIRFARERIAALGRKISTLVIDAPEGAEVLRDGVKLAPQSIGQPIPVDPGEHEMRIHVAGRRDAAVRVSVAAGERRSVVLAPGEAEPQPPPPEVEAPPLPAPKPPPPVVVVHGHPPRTLGWGLVSGGGALVALGAVFGVVTLDRASTVDAHCTPRCDDVGWSAAREGRWMSIASPVALGLGVGLAAAGLYLLFGRRSER